MMRKSVFLCAGASLLSIATTALAQSNPASATPRVANARDDTGVLVPENEIIVTARRREESVQDVPQTVNVVTSAQIDKLNLRNFTEVASVVPGLTLTPGASFGSSATLRGVAFNPEASGNNPTVEFYVNDAPISSNFVFQSLFDVGQFEVQRGPQGTLRGRASPSGSILFSTRRPDLDEVGIVANGTVTNIDAYKLDFAFNLPVIRDVLAVRVAGVIDESQGFTRARTIKQQTLPDFNGDPLRHTKALRVSALFEPTDWLTANVMYQTLNTRSISYQQVQSACLVTGAACPTTATLIRPFDRRSVDDQGTGFVQQHDVLVGNVDARFGGQVLSYVGSYNKQDFNAFGPSDLGDYFSAPRFAIARRQFADPVGFAQICNEENTRTRLQPTNGEFYQCTRTRAGRMSHELRLSSEERVFGIFDYVVGLFYDRNGLNDRPSVLLTQETPLLAAPTFLASISSTAIVRGGGRSKEKSAFGNLTAHITNRLELSGGLRYIDYHADPSVLTVTTPPGASSTNFNIGADDKKTIYNVTAKYQFTQDLMAYVNVGSSYRPGGRAIGNFSTGATGAGPTARELQFANLPAETSTSYEVGAKASFMGGRARLNVSAYRQDFDNFVFRGPGVFFRSFANTPGFGINPSVGQFNFVSAVPVRVKGIEGEASYQILDRWSLGVNASYADGRIRNGTIACTDLNRDGIPDLNPQTPTLAQLAASLPAGENVATCSNYKSRASFASKFSANVQSELGFRLNSKADGFVRALYNFLGRNAADPNSQFDNTSAYGLLNLYAGLRDPDGAWEITAFSKNLLRERKTLSTTNNPSFTTLRQLQFGAGGRVVGVNTTNFAGNYVPVTVTAPREFGLTARIALGSR